MWVYLVILAILLGVLETSRKKSEGCGIPVFAWLEIWFSIVLTIPTVLSFSLCCAKSYIPAFLCWIIWSLWVMLLTAMSWLIYGWALWFSDDNDCGNHQDTNTAKVFMIIILILGLFFMIFAICGIVLLPCAWCLVARTESESRDEIENQNWIANAIKERLSVTKEVPKEGQCMICLEDFSTPDENGKIKEVVDLNCESTKNS
jgi:hypothetical protein